MEINKIYSNLLLLLALIMQISCTSNPFWDDPSKSKLKISGTVTSENNQSNVPIFVWLEGFNMETNTDSNGYFEFVINNAQTSTGNMSGGLQTYFFLYNYKLDSAEIFFTNGQLSYGQTDYSTSGVLTKNIHLQKIFSSKLTHDIPSHLIGDTLILNQQIQSHIPMAIVNYSLQNSPYKSHLFFVSILDGAIYTYTLTGVDQYGNETIPIQTYHESVENELLNFEYLVEMNKIDLPDDTYTIYPYLFMANRSLPNGMKTALGGDTMEAFTDKFLSLPFDQIPDTLTIKRN